MSLTGPSTIGDTIVGFLKSIIESTPEAIAAVITLFTSVRQAIRTVASIVASAATQNAQNQTLATYQDVPLTPAVLADMSIRNLTIPTDASGIDPGLVTEASYSGINPSRFAAMTLDTGESYGVEEALALWHRGSYMQALIPNTDTSPGAPVYVLGPDLSQTYGVPEDELDKVVYYSRIRNEFLPDLKKLSWHAMTDTDVIEMVVKGVIDEPTGLQLFEMAGGVPEHFDALVRAAGDSIGVEKAVELNAFGLVADNELEQIVKQSRINPAFYPYVHLLNTKWIAPYQLEKILAAGAIDEATAITWMEDQGYQPDQAQAFVAMSVLGTTRSVKAETEGMVLADYEAQVITEQEATDALGKLGYTATAIPIILDTIVARRVLSMRNAVITRLRTAFIDYLISETDTRTDLGKLGLPVEAIDQFITFWTIEQATNVKRLSAAQVGHLVEYGYIDAANAVARWTQMGYLPEEANLLLAVYVPQSKGTLSVPPLTSTVPPTGQQVP